MNCTVGSPIGQLIATAEIGSYAPACLGTEHDAEHIPATDDKAGIALSLSKAGNLGTALLANFIITFDYARSRACMNFVSGYEPVPFNRAGLRGTKSDPEHFDVTLVDEGGPAAKAGLRKGDRIIAIEGRAANGLSSGDATLI